MSNGLTPFREVVDPPRQVRGMASRIQRGTIHVVNPDGTVGVKPDKGRAAKAALETPGDYAPTIGDAVLYGDLDGDPQRPVVLQVLSAFGAAPAGPENLRMVGAGGQPAFSTNWSNYGSGFADAGFYKHLGRVYLVGTVDTSATPVSGETIFVLPAGYRPAARQMFPVVTGDSTFFEFGRVDVHADGIVAWYSPGSNVWATLNGISFLHA